MAKQVWDWVFMRPTTRPEVDKVNPNPRAWFEVLLINWNWISLAMALWQCNGCATNFFKDFLLAHDGLPHVLPLVVLFAGQLSR